MRVRIILLDMQQVAILQAAMAEFTSGAPEGPATRLRDQLGAISNNPHRGFSEYDLVGPFDPTMPKFDRKRDAAGRYTTYEADNDC